jgi:rRNA-processing protein FCF1
MKVVLDTNALLAPANYKIDVVTEISRLVPNAELVVLDATLRELSQHPDRKAAKLALSIIDRCGVKSVASSGKTDDAIISYAEKNGAVVFTNDAAMMEKCRKRRIKLMFVKKNKFIELEGE